MRRQLLLGHFLTLLTSGLIYIAFRTETLAMFKWFRIIHLDTPIEYLRVLTMDSKEFLPSWFLFSLPDGLWIFSYLSLSLLIWGNRITRENIFWIGIIPLTAIVSEIGQLFNVVPGTFDLIDLTFYLFATIMPIFLFTNLLTFKTKTI